MNEKYVTYLDFGAKGDGVTDDFEAIWRAHNYANENGLPVVTDDGRTYYIHETRIDGGVKSVIIKTDVTWGSSKFIIDDTDIISADGTGRHGQHIFRAVSDYPMETVTDPEVLAKLIGEGLLDYIAMDVKNSLGKYAETAGVKFFDTGKIEESIALIRESGIPHEFRTTLVKELHTAESVSEIAELIGRDENYYLQRFTDSGDLVEEGFSGHSESEIQKIFSEVKKKIPTVSLRG